MSYLTPSEFDQRCKPDIRKADPDQKALAIAESSSEADGYLAAAGYATPLSEAPASEAFKGHVAAMARYKLATALGLMPEPVEKSSYYLDMRNAVKWFEGIRSGKTVVAGLPTSGESDGEAGEPGAPIVLSEPKRGW